MIPDTEQIAGQEMKISEFNRGYMKAMDYLDVSAEEIADHMNVSRITFYRLKQNGSQYDEKSAREPLLDSDEEYAFIKASETDRDLTAADLTRNSEINKKGVGVDTVETIFNKFGLKSRRKRDMQLPLNPRQLLLLGRSSYYPPPIIQIKKLLTKNLL